MKKLIVCMIFVLLAGGLTIVMPFNASAEKPIELTFTHMHPVGSKFAIMHEDWAKKIEADSQGRIDIKISPGGTLVNAFATYESVEKGVADIGGSFRYSRKGAELTGIISNFFAGVPDAHIATKILDDIRAKFPQVNSEWEGTQEIIYMAFGPATFVTTKPVRNLGDIKGMQIRVPVREVADELKALGGSPVSMRLGEVLMGMKKGTVDGATAQRYAIKDYNLAPTAKYCTLFSLYNPSNYYIVMNKKSYNKLPADLQKVILDSRAWAKEKMISAVEEAGADGLAFGKSQGMEIIELSKEERNNFLTALTPVLDKQAAELDEKGYPSSDVLKFIRERMEVYVK